MSGPTIRLETTARCVLRAVDARAPGAPRQEQSSKSLSTSLASLMFLPMMTVALNVDVVMTTGRRAPPTRDRARARLAVGRQKLP